MQPAQRQPRSSLGCEPSPGELAPCSLAAPRARSAARGGRGSLVEGRCWGACDPQGLSRRALWHRQATAAGRRAGFGGSLGWGSVLLSCPRGASRLRFGANVASLCGLYETPSLCPAPSCRGFVFIVWLLSFRSVPSRQVGALVAVPFPLSLNIFMLLRVITSVNTMLLFFFFFPLMGNFPLSCISWKGIFRAFQAQVVCAVLAPRRPARAGVRPRWLLCRQMVPAPEDPHGAVIAARHQGSEAAARAKGGRQIFGYPALI